MIAYKHMSIRNIMCSQMCPIQAQAKLQCKMCTRQSSYLGSCPIHVAAE